MKKLLSTIILIVFVMTNIPAVFAATGYNKNNIDSYVGQKIIDLNYYHSSKGYYPYKKRLDSSGNMQCVGYAYARLEEKLGLSPDFSSGAGAKDIPNNAPNGKTRTAIDGTVYTIEVYKNDNGSHITANSWVSFGPGSSSYGHVIYVEEVIGDTIYYTESGTSMWKKGTAGTLKKKSKSDFINNCSSGGTYVGTVVFRGGNGGSYTEPTPTPTPSTPAGISLSTSNVNLDYPNSTTQTITVTATGNLPSKYTFELNLGGNISFNWGSSWSGNSINLTLSANQNSNSTTGTIYLKDSSSNSVLTSINFNVNVTKPVVKEYITVYFDTTGSSTSFASQTVEKYGTVTTPNREPNRTGYTFLGWSTNSGVTIGQYSVNETISVGANDLILYAIWQKNQVSWAEWDLTLSDYEIYFDGTNYKEKIVVKIDEQDDRKYYFTYDCDEELKIKWGDDYYDENGYYCEELIVYAPEAPFKNDNIEIEVQVRDGNDNIVDYTSLDVYFEETKDTSFADRNPTGISVYLNGKKLSFDVQPQIINSRTMVPMRKIFEELGTVVGWNNNTQRAISVKKGDVVSVSIGGQYLTVNGEQKLLDSPPIIISGRTLVPVRAVAESFNCDVDWYDFGASQVVDINMQDTINNMENKGGLLIGYSEFAPFSFYDDYGNLIGFDTELAKYVCDFWGWDCSFVEMPFDMGFTAIKTGQIDCYWNAITKTEERMENATFTNDYVEYTYETDENGEWQTWHESYSVPFRKGDYDTVQLVNIALDEAQKDGTIAYLKSKYGIE